MTHKTTNFNNSELKLHQLNGLLLLIMKLHHTLLMVNLLIPLSKEYQLEQFLITPYSGDKSLLYNSLFKEHNNHQSYSILTHHMESDLSYSLLKITRDLYSESSNQL